ncbi:unnamed protein product [Bursaphelenchus okinawaensis]|uniref:Uncharacterized protein n=1 Tax=Bursaphelenchus okinawaensis TaxID=465554 RepID=A0A811KS81_9BILA|nr:unnamed protein product [Bursaphelenchus okinawaensis]CAG9111187.1 unnamed protein product [Bursaphelenchus okinawaensis]
MDNDLLGLGPTSPTNALSFNLCPPPRKNESRDETIKYESINTLKPKLDENLFSNNLDFSFVPSGPKKYYEGCREIHEADIRNSLLVEAKRRKYWGTKAVEKMEFEEIQHSCVYHYILESFTETRSTAEATEPYNASRYAEQHGTESIVTSLNPVSSTTLGNTSYALQNPWDYEIMPQSDFVGQTKVIELPSTSKLISCQTCNAEGVAHCFHCRGFGTDKCGYCRGTGMKAGVAHPAVYTHPIVGTFPNQDNRGYPVAGSSIVRPPNFSGNKPYAVGTPVHFMAKAGLPPPGIGHHDLCLFCQGRGIKDCHHCKGQGKKTCSYCGGHGSVRQYTKLKVFFAVERSDYFTHSEVPEILMTQASGEVSLMETQGYLMPIKKFPINDINEISKKLLAQHMQKSLGACRVIKQRQTVEAVPVAKVHWKLGKKSGIFYVFGQEKLCYIPKSPTKCSVM